MVNSSFSYYRDALLFGMMLNWGLEVQSFDLPSSRLLLLLWPNI